LTRSVPAALVFAMILGGIPRPAAAQASAWPERIWISVSGGVQPAANSFADAFELPLNAETGTVSVAYPVKSGAIVAGAGGVRVWKRLTVGVGVTRYNRRGEAAIDALLPHPFFDNQFRAVHGTAPATRTETGTHLLIGWMLPLADRVRLLIAAGPSALNVRQTFVTGVEFSETFPYDTAAFTRGTTANATARAAGFNAGADVFWMFSRHAGAGGLLQVTRARVNLRSGSRTIPLDAGGAQIGAGMRVAF
jgi:hypothetical protein